MSKKLKAVTIILFLISALGLALLYLNNGLEFSLINPHIKISNINESQDLKNYLNNSKTIKVNNEYYIFETSLQELLDNVKINSESAQNYEIVSVHNSSSDYKVHALLIGGFTLVAFLLSTAYFIMRNKINKESIRVYSLSLANFVTTIVVFSVLFTGFISLFSNYFLVTEIYLYVYIFALLTFLAYSFMLLANTLNQISPTIEELLNSSKKFNINLTVKTFQYTPVLVLLSLILFGETITIVTVIMFFTLLYVLTSDYLITVWLIKIVRRIKSVLKKSDKELQVKKAIKITTKKQKTLKNWKRFTKKKIRR